MTYSSLLSFISATSTNWVTEAVSFGVLVQSSEFASAVSVIGMKIRIFSGSVALAGYRMARIAAGIKMQS